VQLGMIGQVSVGWMGGHGLGGGGGAHTQPGGNFNVTLEAVGLHSHTHTIQYISRVHMHVVVCHSSRRQPHFDSAAQLLLCHPCCSPAVIPLSTIHSTPAGHLCALFQLAHHHSSCPLTFCSINILAVCAVLCVCVACVADPSARRFTGPCTAWHACVLCWG
jgi:hypothetical protein